MKRREFVAGVRAVAVAGWAVQAGAADPETEVKQAIRDNYAAYSGTDVAKYRGTLAPDYVLLEHGQLMGVADDIANMTSRPAGFRRTDVFDFKSTTIEGGLAYSVYILTSDITDQKGSRQQQWLESAILRRSGSRWLLALLHSTRIEAKK